jgi:hypothetical protein
MGFFKKLALLVDEGNRDAMAMAADQCRHGGNLHKALQLYSRLGKDKEAQEIRELLKTQNTYEEDEDLFG